MNNNRATRPQHQSFSDMDKPLYTISVAAEILETHPRTLMLYEDARLIEPHRTTTNRRRYSQRDIAKVQVIQNLTREKGCAAYPSCVMITAYPARCAASHATPAPARRPTSCAWR